jgi:putative redox protein
MFLPKSWHKLGRSNPIKDRLLRISLVTTSYTPVLDGNSEDSFITEGASCWLDTLTNQTGVSEIKDNAQAMKIGANNMSQVLVKAKSKENYKQDVKAGAHSWVVDIPKDKGGEETGPDPHDLLLGSLGACTSITLKMYAKKKGWDLEDVSVNLVQEEVENPNGPGKLNKISREIKVSGNLTEEQIQSLRSIADKCPIHKLLEGPKEITTSIAH